MFEPSNYTGKLFKKYLLAGNHPSKIRMQTFLGKYFFNNGIHLKNFGGTIFNLNANDWITRTMLKSGGYEDLSIKLAKDLLQDGGLFVDVGANFGLYTCILSENKSVTVYAVEPNYMIIPALVNNIKINNRSNVRVLNTALSDGFKLLTLDLPVNNNLGRASFKKDNGQSFSILSCSLNYLFESYSWNTIDLLKIDIEGNEFDVVKNFSFETFPVKNILLEFSDMGSLSFDEMQHFFADKGFETRDVHGQLLDAGIGNLPEDNLWLRNTKFPINS
jgi:FkbM family methyltransferase